jgi:contact-dependent growth inhibition (CDI) system CdiI-like immunity protein
VTGRTTRNPYPQLEAFFAGYLNQEFPEIYGDVAGAIRAFAADASAAERQALAREWHAFRAEVGEDVTVTTLGRLLSSRFGSAWAPRRRAEVDQLNRLIRALGSRA